MQVDPIKPTLNPPGTKRLKLKYDKLLSIILLQFCFQIQLAALHQGASPATAPARPPRRGRAVQVDPIKPPLKAPGMKCLNLKYDILLSSFGIKFNLRLYIKDTAPAIPFVAALCADAGVSFILKYDQCRDQAAGAYTRPLLSST